MRARLRIAILAAVLLALGGGGAGAQNAPLYPVKDCSQLAVQVELNQCAGANYEAADTALNKLYGQLRADQTDAASKQRLTEAERAWIERFLKAMVNPELRAQIDHLPGNTPGKDDGE